MKFVCTHRYSYETDSFKKIWFNAILTDKTCLLLSRNILNILNLFFKFIDLCKEFWYYKWIQSNIICLVDLQIIRILSISVPTTKWAFFYRMNVIPAGVKHISTLPVMIVMRDMASGLQSFKVQREYRSSTSKLFKG